VLSPQEQMGNLLHYQAFISFVLCTESMSDSWNLTVVGLQFWNALPFSFYETTRF